MPRESTISYGYGYKFRETTMERLKQMFKHLTIDDTYWLVYNHTESVQTDAQSCIYDPPFLPDEFMVAIDVLLLKIDILAGDHDCNFTWCLNVYNTHVSFRETSGKMNPVKSIYFKPIHANNSVLTAFEANQDAKYISRTWLTANHFDETILLDYEGNTRPILDDINSNY